MPTLSYCQFENTFHDLEKCYQSLKEQGKPVGTDTESKYAQKLIDLCERIFVDFKQDTDEDTDW
jgi:hypothetical protein